MEATWARRLAASLCVLLCPLPARSAEPARVPKSLPTRGVPAETALPPLPPPLVVPAPPVEPPKSKVRATEAAALRAETEERLKRLDADAVKDPTAANKVLRGVLVERLDWLKEWDKAVKVRAEAEHPESPPERQTADLKAELERIKIAFDQLGKNADKLLPAVFRTAPGQVTDAARAEMKEAVDSAQSDLKDATEKLDKQRLDLSTQGGTTPRAERDKVHQRVVTLPTRRSEREAALTAAKTAEARDLAREGLINFDWEARVEQERLQGIEARMALEAKLADLSLLKLQALEEGVRLAKAMLEAMRGRYEAVADRQEKALKRAAATEEKRAASSDDPVERFRAKRSAELLEFEARVVKDETTLKTKTWPDLEEQKDLASRSEADFVGIKKLLEDGRVSQLDVLRLNNDFRRIGPERDRLIKNELAAATNQLTFYETALSRVELALFNDVRDDRYAYEGILERLPSARRVEATTVFEQMEAKHLALLNRRRKALEDLARRSEETLDEVQRRVRSLDEQYGFIRTHIFWVRDQEPIGPTTVSAAEHDLSRVGRVLFRLAQDLGDRSLWGRLSAEAASGMFLMLTLPWPLFLARRWLQRQRHRPTTASA